MSPDGWKPDTPQRLARATRFFARPISFDLECPRCGTVYQIRVKVASRNWNPSSARFHCTTKTCGRDYIIGLVAWPIIAAPGSGSQPPYDQVPTPRQLAQMRREGGGWWLADEAGVRFKRPLETNLTTEEDRCEAEDINEEDEDR